MSCSSGLDGFRDGGKWPCNRCFVRCCFQDLFDVARSILMQFPSSFFSKCLISVHMVHPYSAAWKKLRFILLDKSDFHMIDNLLIAVHAFASCTMMSFSVDETLIPRYMNFSISIQRATIQCGDVSSLIKKTHLLRFA